jgi:hypothetical protein
MARRETLQRKVAARIAENAEDVFLPREFSDLAGEDQVLRVLRTLVREGKVDRHKFQ